MLKKYRKSLFIFRRDLRLPDNTALGAACEHSARVIPAFFFDPRQIRNNDYRSERAILFMVESLRELDEALRIHGGRLFCFEGIPEKLLAGIAKASVVDSVFFNRDYTPFSLQRDAAIKEQCEMNGIACETFDDVLLSPPEALLKKDKTPYSVFTAFYNSARKLPVAEPKKFTVRNLETDVVSGAKSIGEIPIGATLDSRHVFRGGRREGLRLLKRAIKLCDYELRRDFPAENGTTRLSAHHKFGTISIRETHHAVAEGLGQTNTLLKELYWREFFTGIGFHFPHVFKGAFHRRYDTIHWENDPRKFNRWCAGETGYPIVDAGMRELNVSGFMHNRLRMITASFLVKDLHIDWRWGEKYFARQLIDYDPSVNNGNWQWAASTGCDAQPYFRIFNPWLQQRRFDPDCSYIKRWVPELSALSPMEIHRLILGNGEEGYPVPIVAHAEARDTAEDLYLDCLESK